MDNFYVYMYLRSKKSKHGKNGSPYYVGKGKKMRAFSKQHRVRPPVDKSMIVFVAHDLSESAAYELERALIAQYGRIDKGAGCLRNLSDGEEGSNYWQGKKRSPDTIEKLRQSRLGKPGTPMTEEHKAALRLRNIGIFRSPETRARLSSAAIGRKHVPGQTEKIATALRGRPRSEETKAKISAANLGRSISSETRATISASLKGRHPTEETRQKLIAAHKGKPWTAARAPKRNHSPETIAKMSNARMGHPVSEETKAKLAAQVGWKHSAESRHKMSCAKIGTIPWNKGIRKSSCYLGHPLRTGKDRQDCPTCRAARKKEKRMLRSTSYRVAD